MVGFALIGYGLRLERHVPSAPQVLAFTASVVFWRFALRSYYLCK